jgi:SAM-dependent methyltransferase
MNRCPLCDGGLEPTGRYGIALDRCTGCGSCFAREGRSQAVRSYASDDYLARYEAVQVDARQRRYEARLRLRWMRSHVGRGSLFEAGAAAGYFLDEARAEGFGVSGVEPSPALSEFARRTHGLAVESCLLEDAPAGEPADVVCLWHVLEHAGDPVAMLRDVAGRLVPGGHVFVEVPNIASPVAARLRLRWPALASSEHLTHFTPAGLGAGLRRAGLTPIEVFTIPRWHYRRPAAWASPRTVASAGRDVVAGGGVRRHPTRGDLLRAVARR